MEPITAFLLSMQAAGLVFSLHEKKTQMGYIQQGRALEKAAIDANLEQLNYEYQEQSLNSMKQLRQNLGTQAVMNAARGTKSGVGTALVKTQSAISAQSQDEQARRMNLLAKEANLRASNVLSGLHTLQSETQLGRETLELFKSIPTSSAFDQFRRSDLGKKWGFGFEPV